MLPKVKFGTVAVLLWCEAPPRECGKWWEVMTSAITHAKADKRLSKTTADGCFGLGVANKLVF